ncbi:VOC family protein [Nakamurella sp.]|uniref:VOC family protein n=1 Tax=Nakamurella sp. TaxID=1869182 RepID=UPI003B3BDCCE
MTPPAGPESTAGPAGDAPVLWQTVLDCADPRGLAEFYRVLLGLRYRAGDESSAGPDPDWLVLCRADGARALAFQQVPDYVAPTWPGGDRPAMLHLDTVVPTRAELFRHRDRALALGARVVRDRSDDAQEPLFVLADPAGHPFCVFVAGGR